MSMSCKCPHCKHMCYEVDVFFIDRLQVVWFQCFECSVQWSTTVYHRTRRGTGIPLYNRPLPIKQT